MTKSSPKQIAEAVKNNPSFKKMREMTEAEQAMWRDEVKILESRIETAVVSVDLGNGQKIAIRIALTDAETTRLNWLEDQTKKTKDAEKRIEYTCESIAIITANPLITKEYLMNNRDKYSPSDLLSLILGYLEVRLKEQHRRIANIQSAISFRPDGKGSELR
jgi:hypothetical protein